ncbi:MSMEG_0569 family flavin-dependent oxidoreductase [Roseinatronobacter alkalisoli]|uniref:MSMEG_0569 family flavin-dependent oxidoreductase n=1 Tax=Roseinatronobacter alkalisoli TaxID=3028235 RepID=A0ABT5TDD9_9RHOB|nr:MSMEG_0569 family flavin-dependent oxidoreductase [Roseinatronobacter sp. HJB301]MDD7973137.1 MSMEG_0569 family flavin-dependent oxidoreductase [Roseinatronobacter sp. HJB301]
MNAADIFDVPVAIIGGGQAGLSVAKQLHKKGIRSVIFERHEKFHSWRVNRWDSFCLVTPNWQCRLPGFHYDKEYGGTDPHGFMLRAEITEYLDAFARSFEPDIREHTRVTRVAPHDDGGFIVETTAGTWTCDQVVIATGGYDTPIEPPYASKLDPAITQMHSVDYRSPAQLPDGDILIVGTGQSGVQIMEDFVRAGRKVHLAVGPAPRSPRKYRGRDATDWLYDAGHYDITIDRHPDPHKAMTQTNHYMSGRDGGKEIDLRKWHVDHGVELYGSLADMDGSKLKFLPDLKKNLDDADASYVGICNQIDAYIAREGIDAPEEAPFAKVWEPETERTELDTKDANIASVIWAIGFRPDYSWIEVDVFDGRGKPEFHRGVTDVHGVHFIGLGWLNTWGSGRFLAIEEDSAYLAEQIERQLVMVGTRSVA